MRQREFRLVSPKGAIRVQLGVDGQGVLFYEVHYVKGGETVAALSRSGLGIRREDADLSMGLAYAGLVSERKVVDEYRMIHGKRGYCRNEAREKVFRFRNRDGKVVDVVFRAYDDGVAFRYVFPEEGKGGMITGELTSFVVPEGTQRWMQYTSGDGDGPDRREWGFPALYKLKDKAVWVLVAEADVTRASCASRLCNRDDENVYAVMMPEKAMAAVLPWKSPWRVIMVGSLSGIVESTLVADVSEPARVDTTDWVPQNAAAWVYWAYDHGSKDYGKVVEWYRYSPALKNLGASHNATLPFTRNVIAPMDYTPVTFSNTGLARSTTYAHELALSVVFESGLQHIADRSESFYALPADPQRFLMTVPVAWDDTRLVDGFPGKRVVMGRRSGRSWYIGGLNGEDREQAMELSFGFLDDGVYELQLILDGKTDKEFSRKMLTVKKDSRVSVDCLPRGGFAGTVKPR